MCCAETAERIEMSFGMWTWVCPETAERIEMSFGLWTCVCPETAERIEMSFGLWTCVCPRKHVLNGDACWRHLANMIEPFMCGGDAA